MPGSDARSERVNGRVGACRWGTIIAMLAVVAVLVPVGGEGSLEVEGALRATVASPLRPAGGAITTVRAIDARTVSTVAGARVGAAGTYRISLPPGIYVVLVEKVAKTTQPLTGFGRLTRLRSAKTSVIPRVQPGSATARRTTSGLTGRTAFLAPAAPTKPAVAVRYLSATGPKPYLGRGLSNMLVTDLFGSSCYVLVEWEERELLQQEIRLQQSKWVDPSTRVTPRPIQPKYFVEGSLATTDSTSSWSVRVREIATGRIVATDSGRSANLVDASPGIGKRLRKQLEEELCGFPRRFVGSFSGENRVAGVNSYTGTVTFVRNASSPAGTVTYHVESVRWNHRFTAETPCRVNASTTVTVAKPDPGLSVLAILKGKEARGYRYSMTASFASPKQLTVTVTCNGVQTALPWVPGAALDAGPGRYTDGEVIAGRYEATGAASTYTWDLRGSD